MSAFLICARCANIFLDRPDNEEPAIGYIRLPGPAIQGSISRTVKEKQKLIRLDRFSRRLADWRK